jgi:hypothetical protein
VEALAADQEAMTRFMQGLVEWRAVREAAGEYPSIVANWFAPAAARDQPGWDEYFAPREALAQRARDAMQAIADNAAGAARYLLRHGGDPSLLRRWVQHQGEDGFGELVHAIDAAHVRYELAVEELKRRAVVLQAEQAQPAEPPVIWSLGDSVYRVGDGRPVEVSQSEDDILQAFMRHPAMGEKTLASETHDSNARTTLLRMLDKYDGVFAAAIHRPPGKSAGGYSATVRKPECNP